LSSATERPWRRRLLAGLSAAAAAACQPAARPDPAASARIVQASPAEAVARAADQLRSAGFKVTELAGATAPTLRGELGSGGDPDWARCPGIWTNDPFSDVGRSRFVQAGSRRTIVVVRTSALPQGTSVEVDAHTLGVYRHAFTGQDIESPCDTTGRLEARLLAAAAGGPA
jgi:hypothetical protein